MIQRVLNYLELYSSYLFYIPFRFVTLANYRWSVVVYISKFIVIPFKLTCCY